ncbi:MAG TPA: toprim domain-containing protein, partial [Candidatus Nanoarchaeia archaeon]|nr:toprim domain-containing protein [Candidatus Nanoarchaeia archaeon]
MTELIISEKPKSAQKIAEALADGKPSKKSDKGIPYYEIRHGKKKIIVASTVGHIFGLGEKKKGKWTYPVFDVEWKPLYEIDKKSDFVKKYISTLKKLCKDADEFTIACDYDVEGEVIGLNALRYACKKKDAH